MTANIRNPHVQTLCTLALADESSLQFPLPDAIFGFHAQQAIEKLLKALIAAHSLLYPRTHALKGLMDLLALHGEQMPSTSYAVLLLQPFAVEFRYDLTSPLAEGERKAIRETVAILRTHILGRILAIESAAPQTPKLP